MLIQLVSDFLVCSADGKPYLGHRTGDDDMGIATVGLQLIHKHIHGANRARKVDVKDPPPVFLCAGMASFFKAQLWLLLIGMSFPAVAYLVVLLGLVDPLVASNIAMPLML